MNPSMHCSENKECIGGVIRSIRALFNDSGGRNMPRVLSAFTGPLAHCETPSPATRRQNMKASALRLLITATASAGNAQEMTEAHLRGLFEMALLEGAAWAQRSPPSIRRGAPPQTFGLSPLPGAARSAFYPRLSLNPPIRKQLRP